MYYSRRFWNIPGKSRDKILKYVTVKKSGYLETLDFGCIILIIRQWYNHILKSLSDFWRVMLLNFDHVTCPEYLFTLYRIIVGSLPAKFLFWAELTWSYPSNSLNFLTSMGFPSRDSVDIVELNKEIKRQLGESSQWCKNNKK